MDMPEGDPTNPKDDNNCKRWKAKIYNNVLVKYANKDIIGDEAVIYQQLFDEITQSNKLDKAEHLMLLDNALFDYLRIKRLQKLILEEGDVVSFKLKSGRVIKKAHEASYLLNAIETQFRNTMKELLLTKREVVKKNIGLGAQDFASFLSAEVVDVKEDG